MHPKVSPDNGFYQYYKDYMNEMADYDNFCKFILEVTSK